MTLLDWFFVFLICFGFAMAGFLIQCMAYNRIQKYVKLLALCHNKNIKLHNSHVNNINTIIDLLEVKPSIDPKKVH